MTRRFHKYSSKKISRGEPPNFSGQHFMHNKKLIHEIINQAKLNKQETVLELGAGKGALTMMLSEKAGEVIAFEYDEKLVHWLREKMAQAVNTKIIQQDILAIRLPRKPFVVVANIPYSITTAIMKLLLNDPSSSFQRGIIVMEKGAGRRFTSSKVKDAYVLTWRMFFELNYVRCISRSYFSPPPSVDSAMIRITRKQEEIILPQHAASFLRFAAYALQQPQASVDFALRGIFTSPQMKHLKRSLNLSKDTAIGALNEGQWGIIFNTMVAYVPRSGWPKAKKK